MHMPSFQIHNPGPRVRRGVHVGLMALWGATAGAASLLPSTPADRAGRAEGVVLAELAHRHGVKPDGTVMTRHVFRTVEVLKGTFPAYFELHTSGGEWKDVIHADSRFPTLTPDTQYLLFVEKRGGRMIPIDGPLGAVDPETVELPALRAAVADMEPGGDFTEFEEEPMSVQFAVTSSGLLDNGGFRRFTEGDRDQAVPVLADVSTLPSGITGEEALIALRNALDAWEAVSTVQFRFEGTEVFAKSADEFDSEDGLVVRVQFHDNFDKISDTSNTLGFGGATFSGVSGSAGTLDGDPFHLIRFGYVILNHPKSALGDEVTLEEVVAHELGHVLGLAHSSETDPETDPELEDAQMYFLIHKDGRGADPRTWDVDTAAKAYPANTPPYSFDRKFHAVTVPGGWTLSNPEVNQVVMEGWDLNDDPLSFSVTSGTTINGSFSLSGNTVTYTPSGFFADSDVSDPADIFNDQLIGTLSDGVNLSPPVEVWIIGFRTDTEPANTPDGVPDAYMTTHYGSADGSTAGADTDGDGFTTLEEFLMRTDPTDPDSGLILTGVGDGTVEWTGRRFDLFRVQTSSDLTVGDWTTIRLATQPEDLPVVTEEHLPSAEAGGALFYRVRRVD